jgi:hypothetical protein
MLVLSCAFQLALQTVAREVFGSSSSLLLPVITDEYVWAWITFKVPVPTGYAVCLTASVLVVHHRHSLLRCDA